MGRLEGTHKNQRARNIKRPKKTNPSRIRPGLPKSSRNNMEAERDDEKKTEADELDAKTDFHDVKAALLFGDVVAGACDAADGLYGEA